MVSTCLLLFGRSHSWLFVKHPQLILAVRQARLLVKKYDPERSGGVEIIFSKPAQQSAAALSGRNCGSEICRTNSLTPPTTKISSTHYSIIDQKNSPKQGTQPDSRDVDRDTPLCIEQESPRKVAKPIPSQP